MNIFQSIRVRKPKRNKFDLGHEKKFSTNMGNLTPILVQDVLPGDTFKNNTEIMMRFAPMLAPIMHRVNVWTHFFFVPNRLVWDEFEDFITGGEDGLSAPASPYITCNNSTKAEFDIGSLADYMGFPAFDASTTTVTQSADISALPFRAYQMIYNEFYRDQNLTAAIDFGIGSGNSTSEITKLTTMRNRCWEKDYFTSALPWAQRGAAVNIPITGTGSPNYWTQSYNFKTDGSDPTAGATLRADAAPNSSNLENSSNEAIRIENIDDVSLDNVTATINDLRRAERLQEWLEKNARGGARYIEQIMSHFGVKSSDARLQRPEYLGGGRTPVTISEVLSTFEQSAEGIPQGNMAGHGIAVGKTHGFKKTFEEHGYIIGIMSVLPKTAYQQGIPRHFRRTDKFDYAWPELANIGEQEIKTGEIWYDPTGSSGDIDGDFGYTPRFAEYKYAPSTVHGVMRDTLSFWHMGRIFSSAPSLNTSFVESDPTTRIFAVADPGDEHMYCQLYNNMHALRPLPYFGTPKL